LIKSLSGVTNMQIQDGNTAANQAPQTDVGVTTTTTVSVDTAGAGSVAQAATTDANPGTDTADTSAGTATVASTAAPHLSLIAQLEADMSTAFDTVDEAETAAIAGIRASVQTYIAKVRALLAS